MKIIQIKRRIQQVSQHLLPLTGSSSGTPIIPIPIPIPPVTSYHFNQLLPVFEDF